MQPRIRSIVLAAALLASGLVPGLQANASTLSVTAARADIALTASPRTPQPVNTSCPPGTTLVGGGGWTGRAADPTQVPETPYWMKSLLPVDASGNPVANGSTDPTTWQADPQFGPMTETTDKGVVFAMCATNGPTATIVRTASVNSAATAGNPPLKATATCQPGEQLVGGGILLKPDNTTNYISKASYPSDAAGNPATNNAFAPDSWTGYSSFGFTIGGETTTVYAVCATAGPPMSVQVAVTDAPSPSTAGTFTNTTATCPNHTTLLDGGWEYDETVNNVSGLEPNQGLHSRGSYPSDASGNMVAGGTVDATSWSVVTQPGGLTTLNTTVHAYALCARYGLREHGAPALG